MHEMRRIDRQLTTEEAKIILENGEYGVLSTVDENGIPYGVPISYAYADNTIYFHCASGVGHKVANIEYQPKVCFTVVGNTEVLPQNFSTKYESVVAFGTARLAQDKHIGLTLLQKKYSPDFAEKGKEYIESALEKTAVYEIEIEDLKGKGRK